MSGRRWIVDHVGAPVFERLATELSGSELQSVLLEVMQRRVYVATGAGAQLIAYRFRAEPTPPSVATAR